MQGGRPAEDYADYRFFRFFALNGARLTVACLFLLGWAYVIVRGEPYFGNVLFFIATTLVQALVVSLLAALVSYTLFKRRGGKVEKSPKPPGF